jgi:carbamoyl-phosphate synthase large subunit
MGLASTPAEAFAKSQLAAGTVLPTGGRVFIALDPSHRAHAQTLAADLMKLGFDVVTGKDEDARKDLAAGAVQMLIQTVKDGDGAGLRREALMRGVPFFTTLEAARMATAGIEALKAGCSVTALQDVV